MKRILMLVVLIVIMGFVVGCSDADVASQNLSKAADQFEVFRRVVFYNGITDEYILMIEGYCSVEFFTDKFVVTVKTGPGQYMKHYLGRADNVFPFVEQLEVMSVSDAQYRVVFKPSIIVPNIDLE